MAREGMAILPLVIRLRGQHEAEASSILKLEWIFFKEHMHSRYQPRSLCRYWIRCLDYDKGVQHKLLCV